MIDIFIIIIIIYMNFIVHIYIYIKLYIYILSARDLSLAAGFRWKRSMHQEPAAINVPASTMAHA